VAVIEAPFRFFKVNDQLFLNGSFQNRRKKGSVVSEQINRKFCERKGVSSIANGPEKRGQSRVLTLFKNLRVSNDGKVTTNPGKGVSPAY
jgi:hypothetical protein